MTKLKDGATVTRETGMVLRGRVMIVELGEHKLVFRPKGTRQAVTLDLEVAYECALKVEAREAGVKV